MRVVYFDHCPDETADPETDGCRGCVGYSVGGDPCGAVWRRPDGSEASHEEVRSVIEEEDAAKDMRARLAEELARHEGRIDAAFYVAHKQWIQSLTSQFLGGASIETLAHAFSVSTAAVEAAVRYEMQEARETCGAALDALRDRLVLRSDTLMFRLERAAGRESSMDAALHPSGRTGGAFANVSGVASPDPARR